MTRRGITALLLIVAAALALGLVRYDTNTITTYANHSVHRTLPDDPVIILSMSITDFACFVGSPCKVAAAARIKGLFPRVGIPRPVALYAGVVAPFLIVCAALVVLLPRPRHALQIVRIFVSTALFAMALYLIAQLGSFPIVVNISLLENARRFWQLLIPPTVGLLVLIGATALLLGAYKLRKRPG